MLLPLFLACPLWDLMADEEPAKVEEPTLAKELAILADERDVCPCGLSDLIG